METLITVLVILVAIYVIDKTVERFMLGKEVKHLKEAYQKKLQEASVSDNEPVDIRTVKQDDREDSE